MNDEQVYEVCYGAKAELLCRDILTSMDMSEEEIEKKDVGFADTDTSGLRLIATCKHPSVVVRYAIAFLSGNGV